ncbi:type II toxin-antitoxin system RelE/ParE family toxin [Saccharopolyspora shandongensis]|uniref:type II toxin-antitoxin system RelE/ParE family toxin n=1 Tax=Saccharopolyspora shandongensis TaxID=418495 RepID=UPI003410D209
MPWGAVEPEVRDWLVGLCAAHRATAAFYVDLLEERGPLLDEPYTRRLDGKLRELRFHLDGRSDADHVLDRSRAPDRAPHRLQEGADARDAGGVASKTGLLAVC